MNIPKHWSLAEDNKDHFVIHDHRDDKRFKVSKAGLHPATQIKVMKMQKFDDGGDVQDLGGVGSIVNGQPPQSPSAPPQPSGASGDWEQPTPQAAPQPVPDAAPPQGDVLSQYNANSAQELKGLEDKGKAEAASSAENAKTLKTSNDQLKDIFAQSQQDLWNQNVENQNLSQQIASTKIDPNHYYNSKSVGGKIGTAISLIVGGIGAGLTHGPNMAYETIQKAIANDIEAQRANLANKQSLLSDNLKKYGDMKAATQATMLQMNAIVQGQLAATAAKYGSQADLGGSQALLGQMKNQQLAASTALQQQLMEQKIKQHLAGGDVSGQNPLDYVKHVVPAAEQGKVADELGKAQFVAENHDKMMHLWDQAQKEQTMARTGFGLVDAPATRELRALGDPLIHDQEGRVNEFEKKDFEGLLPSSGQTDGRQRELRDGFETFINNKKSAPIAKTYGIDINRFNSTGDNSAARLTGKDQQAYQWAKQNPNNKMSAMILEKLGQK
jgi:hypothetical protein